MRYHIYCNIHHLPANHNAAITEFTKRLQAYCTTVLNFMPALDLPKDILKEHHHVLFLTDGFSTYSSEEFASYIGNLPLNGVSTLHVIIGFQKSELYDTILSLQSGLEPDFISLSCANLSCESTTLLFLEQLYRSYTILQGKTYHK